MFIKDTAHNTFTYWYSPWLKLKHTILNIITLFNCHYSTCNNTNCNLQNKPSAQTMFPVGVTVCTVMCSPPLCHYQGRWWPVVLWGWLYLTLCHPQGPTRWWSPGRMAAGNMAPGCFHLTPLLSGQRMQAEGDRYPARPGYKHKHVRKHTSKQVQRG